MAGWRRAMAFIPSSFSSPPSWRWRIRGRRSTPPPFGSGWNREYQSHANAW